MTALMTTDLFYALDASSEHTGIRHDTTNLASISPT